MDYLRIAAPVSFGVKPRSPASQIWFAHIVEWRHFEWTFRQWELHSELPHLTGCKLRPDTVHVGNILAPNLLPVPLHSCVCPGKSSFILHHSSRALYRTVPYRKTVPPYIGTNVILVVRKFGASFGLRVCFLSSPQFISSASQTNSFLGKFKNFYLFRFLNSRACVARAFQYQFSANTISIVWWFLNELKKAF